MGLRTAISVVVMAAATVVAAAGCGVEQDGGLDRAARTTPTSAPVDERADEDRPEDGEESEALDALQDECEAGDDRACDLLFLTAPIGSAYEGVGADCAGRPTAETFCSPEAEWGDDGFAPEDSAGMPVLAADCEAGELTACDLLFQLARPGSDFEDVGHTCAGEVRTGALPDCRTQLGG